MLSLKTKWPPILGYCSDRLGDPIEDFAGNYEEMDCLCAQVL